jgi:hypothetical protein
MPQLKRIGSKDFLIGPALKLGSVQADRMLTFPNFTVVNSSDGVTPNRSWNQLTIFGAEKPYLVSSRHTIFWDVNYSRKMTNAIKRLSVAQDDSVSVVFVVYSQEVGERGNSILQQPRRDIPHQKRKPHAG